MEKAEEHRAIGEVAERLSKSFPQLPSEQVEKAVNDSRPEFDDAPVRDFVPLFVERAAKHRLRRIVR